MCHYLCPVSQYDTERKPNSVRMSVEYLLICTCKSPDDVVFTSRRYGWFSLEYL